MNKRMMIIDGFSLANRAFFALPPLETSGGQPTNAVYGLTLMLLKILDEARPDYLVTAFDTAVPTFRHQEYREYKAQRLKMEESLKSQLPIIRELHEILRIPIYEKPGYEADDIIGAFSVKAVRAGLDVEIVTGDRDLFQLTGPGVKVLYTRKGITEVDAVDEAYIRDRYQLAPANLVDLKGLMGDASDNIPGVPGFGEKTALKYLALFGTVEGIFANLDQITRARDRDLLTEHKEKALLSKHLAKIKTDFPIDLDLNQCCRPRDYDREALLGFCKEYEFKNLLKKLAGAEEAIPVGKLPELRFSVAILTDDLPETAVEKINAAGWLAIQFLTLAADWTRVDCLGLGIGGPTENWFFPLAGGMKFPESVRKLLESDNLVKLGHDLKKQLRIASMLGIEINGRLEDLLLGGYLLNAGLDGLELEDLSRDYLRQTIPFYSNERGVRYSVFQLPPGLSPGKLSELAGGRLESLKLIKGKFQTALAENGLKSLYNQVELPLLKVLFEMERTGVKIDPEVLRKFKVELKAQQQELETDIYDLTGVEFNIASPKQLGKILYEKLGLNPPKKNKTGYSTDAAVLESMADRHPVIPKILAYRQNLKLQTTYIDSLIDLINPRTGRVHTTFNQAVTTTGRLSSVEPNLQNIPVRSEEGKRIRNAFIPADGNHLLLAADYSQIELRVMAHFSADEAFRNAFINGEDIHRFTAAAIRGISPEAVTREMRDQAKAVNFGIIYGISGFGLARNIGISRREADEFIKAYFEKYPGVKAYVDRLITEAKETGAARTLLGRIRKLPDLQSRNFTMRSFAERMARNTPIQGTAADIIKVAMVKIAERLREEPKLGKLLLQVHDELVFEVPRTHWQELAGIVKKEMEGAVFLKVPLVVDFKIGTDWGGLAPVKLED